MALHFPVFLEGELPAQLAIGAAERTDDSPWWMFHDLTASGLAGGQERRGKPTCDGVHGALRQSYACEDGRVVDANLIARHDRNWGGTALIEQTQRHVQSIATSSQEYSVKVGGSVDGESLRDPVGYGNYIQSWENNLWTRLENVGSEIVVNPWIHIDGQRRWHCIEQIVESVVEPDMSEADRARAIWEFARRHRYHRTTRDDEVKDTVKMLNVYGYTLCWDEAYTLSNLWQAAGLNIRRGLPHGHCTTEVFYDGGWHLLDSDEHLLVLNRDNETIAGETEISRDHDLMKRSHAYGILSPEDRRGSEDVASLFCHAGGRAGSRPRIGDHRMDLSLRPGEALTWNWGDRGRYHGYGDPPPRFCNGALSWSPPWIGPSLAGRRWPTALPATAPS